MQSKYSKEFDSRFIRYYLITPAMQSYLLALAGSGATRNALTKGMIEGLEIPKPDINVQKEIADVLSSLDDKIQLNRQINQTLEHIAQAIFKNWFVDFEPVKAKAQVRASVAEGRTPGSDQNTPLPPDFDVEAAVQRAAMCAISGKTETELDLCDQQTLQQLKTTAALFPDALVESELGEVPEGWDFVSLSKVTAFANERIEVSKLSLDNYISTENMLENKQGVDKASWI